jgi:phosphate transport system substrate-binding protein
VVVDVTNWWHFPAETAYDTAVKRSTLLCLLAALVASVCTASPASAVTHTLIEGSGSSWAATAVSQWIADVQPLGLQVVYTPDGSAAGKQDFANMVSDFAITDIPYLGHDPITGTNDSSDGREYGDIPIAAGATTFPYHLTIHGKQVRSLRLSSRTLARIFTDQITNWDDPAITADNNGIRLPSLEIIPVVHSEGSGVTYDFTTYLADRFPELWKAFDHSARPTQYYPTAGHQIAENGSDAVMNFIRSPASNGAIGVDEYSYTLDADYPVAKVENPAGYFVTPSPYNVSIALRSATIDENPADSDYMRPDLKPVFASTDRRAYPLSFYSSLLVPTSTTDAKMTTAKRQTLVDFAYYGICQGQRVVGPVGYAPLPLNLVEAGFTQIDRLKAADPDVDLTDRTVSTCDNPTFLSHNLKRNYLGSIAPEPLACDKRGQGPCAVDTFARLTVSKPTVKAGHSVVFHGRLLNDLAAGGPPHAIIRLQRRVPHHGWTTISIKKTSTAGTVTVRLVPAKTADYRLVDAEPGSGRPVSNVLRVKVN